MKLGEEVHPGARPIGVQDPAAAAASVQEMFDAIAPSYDRLNHLLSFGLDRFWWRRTARAFAGVLARPEARIVDLCCGTGDQTAALLARRPASSEPVVGLDFSREMLRRAGQKYPKTNVQWVEGDAMHLPFADGSVDLITAAFGFRNLANYADGLREIARVLRPGGQIGILEANQPEGLRALAYNTYFHHLLPMVGGWLSGERAAYAYLPASVKRFPRPPQMLRMLRETGFVQVNWDGYLLHAAGLYRGTRADS